MQSFSEWTLGLSHCFIASVLRQHRIAILSCLTLLLIAVFHMLLAFWDICLLDPSYHFFKQWHLWLKERRCRHIHTLLHIYYLWYRIGTMSQKRVCRKHVSANIIMLYSSINGTDLLVWFYTIHYQTVRKRKIPALQCLPQKDI
jgi:hypothetical protein